MSAAGVNPEVTALLEALFGDRLVLRIHDIDPDSGEQIGGQRQRGQLAIEGIIGSPEGRSIGSPGDLRVRLDTPQLWQKITGTRTRTGWQLVGDGGGGGSEITVQQNGIDIGLASTLNLGSGFFISDQGGGVIDVSPRVWVERYLGRLSDAPSVDLANAVPPNPVLTIPNSTETPGQVADAGWISNAGDATVSVTQGMVTSYASDGSDIVMVGASASTLMTETSQQAPHVYVNWNDVLGEDPRGGTEYCVMIRFSAQDLATTGQASGPVIYSPNDGVAEPNITGLPAIDDEKRTASWIEVLTGVVNIVGREESTPFQGINGPLIPANFDTVGILMTAGGSIIQTLVGVSDGDQLPDPDQMSRVPGPFLGGSTTFPSHPYGTPLERIAVANQQQFGSTYTTRVDTIRVLSREGRPAA